MKKTIVLFLALFLFVLLILLNCTAPADRTVNSLNGLSISYHVEGSGSPGLVFVRGWCCDKSYWDRRNHFRRHKKEKDDYGCRHRRDKHTQRA